MLKFFKGCDDSIHKFEARYDKSEARIPWDRIESINVYPKALESMREITYVRDVCVRCGVTIERNSEIVPLRKIA